MVIAPNAFKGTLTAAAAARAIRAGVAQAWPGAECRSIPLADGGDGFLETLLGVAGSSQFQVQVAGPLQGTVWAKVGLLRERSEQVAVVELASSCGLSLIDHPSPATSLQASTRGLGELIVAALGRSARRVLIGLGGSASTDGGAGLGQALGFRFLDRHGESIATGGLGLTDLDRIEAPETSSLPQDGRLVAACDVDSPLLGALGAAATFAPQKGADPPTVLRLEKGLTRLAQLVERDLHISSLESQPGMGAAGGTAFGLAVFGRAHLESGVSLVAKWVGLDEALNQADLVITGEGRLDQGSFRGKVTGEVLQRCLQRQLPCLVLAGSADPWAERQALDLGGRVCLTSEAGGAPLTPTPETAFSLLREATTRACRGGD